jgi:dihydrofolate reductase
VITRNREYVAEDAVVCGSLKEALEWAGRAPGSNEVFVIGGGEIFREALPLADRIYLTVVEWPFEGDAFFPAFDEKLFTEKAKERLSENPPAVLRVLEKKSPRLDWNK